jgi:hypothetical protein
MQALLPASALRADGDGDVTTTDGDGDATTTAALSSPLSSALSSASPRPQERTAHPDARGREPARRDARCSLVARGAVKCVRALLLGRTGCCQVCVRALLLGRTGCCQVCVCALLLGRTLWQFDQARESWLRGDVELIVTAGEVTGYVAAGAWQQGHGSTAGT